MVYLTATKYGVEAAAIVLHDLCYDCHLGCWYHNLTAALWREEELTNLVGLVYLAVVLFARRVVVEGKLLRPEVVE